MKNSLETLLHFGKRASHKNDQVHFKKIPFNNNMSGLALPSKNRLRFTHPVLRHLKRRA